MHVPLMTPQLIPSQEPVSAVVRTPGRPAVVASSVGLVDSSVAGEIGGAGEGAVAGGVAAGVAACAGRSIGGDRSDGRGGGDGDRGGKGGKDGKGRDDGVDGGGGDGIGSSGSRRDSRVVDEVVLDVEIESLFGQKGGSAVESGEQTLIGVVGFK